MPYKLKKKKVSAISSRKDKVTFSYNFLLWIAFYCDWNCSQFAFFNAFKESERFILLHYKKHSAIFPNNLVHKPWTEKDYEELIYFH